MHVVLNVLLPRSVLIEPGASWSVPSLYCAAAAIARARLRIFGPFHGRSSRYCLPLAPPRSGDRFGGLSGGMVGWFGARPPGCSKNAISTSERKEVRRRVALKACSAFSLLARPLAQLASLVGKKGRPHARIGHATVHPSITAFQTIVQSPFRYVSPSSPFLSFSLHSH